MTETTTYRPIDAAQQIAEKASAEMSDLQAKIAHLEQRMNMASVERATLSVERSRRSEHLSVLKNNLDKVQTQHRDAVSYASVAQGTISEQDTVKQVVALKKQLVASTTDYQTTEREHATIDASATDRLAQIDADLERMTIESASHLSRLRDVERVSTRAVQELGEHTYEELFAEYQEHTDRIEALKREVVDLEVKRQQFLDQAQGTLASWPRLAHKIGSHQPYDDAITRCVRAATLYVETLLKDGASLPGHLALPITSNYYTWVQMLEVSRDNLYLNETLSSEKRGLKQHLRNLQTLQSQYLATRR